MFTSLFDLINKIKPIQSLNVGYDSGGRLKPTVLMLHGIGATYHTWDNLIKELDHNKYRVIAVDILGCGDSPLPDNCEYRVDDHVRYLRKTIKKLRIKKPFIIIGHSMGSIISAKYCRIYPRDVSRTFLLSLPLYFKGDVSKNFSHKRTDFYIKAYEFLCEQKDFAIKYAKRVRGILRIKDGINIDEKYWDGFSKSLKNTIIKQQTYHDIVKLKLPIEIIFGSLDEFLVQENLYRLDKYKNIKIIKLNGINHTINTRFAKKVAEQINALI